MRYDDLSRSDLTIGAVYEQGHQHGIASEPLHRILPGVGNQGGFRAALSKSDKRVLYVALFTSGLDPDWPDRLDPETGHLVYFGDNKAPGSELHSTPRRGNLLLKNSFEALHDWPPRRAAIPPYFVFGRPPQGRARDVSFLGLAVPGSPELEAGSDLVAIWRTTNGARFQNYRARFTVLDTGTTVKRAWLDELASGDRLGKHCPEAFRSFVERGSYRALRAPRTRSWRNRSEQGPATKSDAEMLKRITSHFSERPHDFEACAIELWRMLANESVSAVENTRKSRDGGRDAVGRYSLGPPADPIDLEFGLEAKCYSPGNFAGVRDVARLISRLRHREFGVFVTTTGLNEQAYRELREDRHPVVVVCGRDIVELLRQHGFGSAAAVSSWLNSTFPMH